MTGHCGKAVVGTIWYLQPNMAAPMIASIVKTTRFAFKQSVIVILMHGYLFSYLKLMSQYQITHNDSYI